MQYDKDYAKTILDQVFTACHPQIRTEGILKGLASSSPALSCQRLRRVTVHNQFINSERVE
ncbi:MAG: hypothetical protein WBS33_16350 [Verrucomicrobiia bacterium]